MPIYGIDISHWNTINFADLRDTPDLKFVGVKATEGGSFVDQRFVKHYTEALANGFYVMPYHFFRSNVDGGRQAQHFLSVVNPLIGKEGVLPPMLDIETTDGVGNTTRIANVHKWLKAIESNWREPGFYSSPGFWNVSMTDPGVPVWANGYWQWVAHWTAASTPILPAGWSFEKTKFWQIGIYPKHSWVPKVFGVSGEVDVNIFLGTEKELKTMADVIDPSPPPPPPPPPPPDTDYQTQIDALSARADNLEQIAARLLVARESDIAELKAIWAKIKAALP